MIDWKNHFDHIYCLHYVKNFDRYDRISKEFYRVGILQSGVFSWSMTVDSPLKDKMYKSLPVHKDYAHWFKLQGYADTMFNHYSIIKQSLALGHSRILVFENDICFLKSLQDIEMILNNIPKDYDLMLLDYFEYYKHSSRETGRFTQVLNSDKTIYHGLSGYSMSSKMMKMYVDILENEFYALDDLWNRIDKSQFSFFVSNAPLCIQCPSKTCVSTSNPFAIYQRMGIDISQYNA